MEEEEVEEVVVKVEEEEGKRRSEREGCQAMEPRPSLRRMVLRPCLLRPGKTLSGGLS